MAGAERLKTFIDAVVAIAMTLLILPLMESVIEAGTEHVLPSEWLSNHFGPIFSFLLSFLLIADAWRDHHRLFDAVERSTTALVWLSVAWMVTIVWLPVPTAMVGTLDPDTVGKLLYIGTLLATRLVMLVTRVYLIRNPRLHAISRNPLRQGTIANTIIVAMLAIILVVAVAIRSGNGLYALALLALVGPIQGIVWRRMQAREAGQRGDVQWRR